MARQFVSASGDGILVPHTAALDYTDVTTPRSYSAWFTNTAAAVRQCIFSKNEVGSPFTGWVWRKDHTLNPMGNSISVAYSGNFLEKISNTNGYSDGVLRHMVTTYDGGLDGSGVLMYVNGALVSSYTNINNLSGGSTANPRDLGIGQRYNGSQSWDGNLSELAIWDAELSAGEAAALSRGASPFSVRGDSLRHYWPLYGTDSPELEFGGTGLAGNVTGTTKVPHPAVELIENYL